MTAGVASVIRIGILTHNALHHTKRCIASLQAHTSVPWQAVILDNASSDDTRAWLASLNDPRIEVELHAENLGVGGGRNWLFGRLLPHMRDDELLVFLDNDIEVGAGWAEPFVDAFAAMPRLGVAGRWAFSMHVHETWRDILSEHAGAPGPVDTVQGCCFWVRGAAARALGGFDEALGRFWHEDDDYCIRALHAGWEVQRVRNAAITHHEHGSGVALKPERIAGSCANQAYLIDKWRALGAIDAYGVPKRPTPEVTAPLREALATRLGRTQPLLRTEMQGVIADASALLRGDIADDRAAVLATPAVRRMLSDAATRESGETQRRAQLALERIARILAERRAEVDDTETIERARSGGRAFSTLCDPSAWDDARWMESYQRHFRDGAGADYYARSEIAWRDGQLLHVARATGALRAGMRVLVLGHASERVIAPLTHVAAEVAVLDHEMQTMEVIAGSATRTLGDATLMTGRWSEAQSLRATPFDLVLCPNAARYAPPADYGAVLSALAQLTRTGGHVGLGASVRLTGPRNGRWLERDALTDDAALARHGVRRLGKFDDRICDETLLAAIPPEGQASWRPQLARAVGPHRVTLATLFCRRTE